MKIRFLFFFSLLFCSLPPSQRAFAQAAARAPLTNAQVAFEALERENFSQSRAWHKLLHFEKTRLGTRRSQADGKEFFNAPEGDKNPKAELLATLELFYTDQQKRCQFPARFKVLAQAYPPLGDLNFLERCEKYQDFKSSINAQSATLVFSSYYLNSPASAFGHTLLRLNKGSHSDKQRPELLDTGINFAANPTTENPLLYPFFGLVGLFQGTYSRMPYYYKVREYGDFESRDLWEYNLKLSPFELELLVAHIWELGHTHFNYYYLTENCSYHMLTVLEAAAPRLSLSEKLPFWIIPSDTILALFKNPDLVESVKYRPSLRSQFFNKAKLLSKSEKSLVKKLGGLDAPVATLIDGLPPEQQIRILDAANDFIEFKNPDLLNAKNSNEISQHRHTLLKTRASLGPSMAHATPTPYEGAPQTAHPSLRSGLKIENPTQDFLLEHRFALHDALDPIAGYAPHSTLEFLKTALRIKKNQPRITLEALHVVSVETLSPLHYFHKKPSWKLQLGFDRKAYWPCAHCLAGGAMGAVGYAVALDEYETFLVKASLLFDLNISRAFAHTLNFSAGPKLSLLHNSKKRLSLELSSARIAHAPYKTAPLNVHAFEVGYAPLHSFQLRFSGERIKTQNKWALGFYLYY